ncbi:hypothetical protein CR513_10219, partial [Mucuna pruriens]
MTLYGHIELHIKFRLRSPYRIIFSKACHLPVEIEHRAYWVVKQCNLAYDQAGKQRNRPESKLHSRWDGPFVITNAFPYDVVELKDEHTNNTFQVNRHQIKLFHEGPTPTVGEIETISLMESAPLDDIP